MARTHTTLSSLFTAIANAIRSKTGSTSEIVADDFPNEISSISVGTDVSDTTAAAADVRVNKVFYAADGTQTSGTLPDSTTGSSNTGTNVRTITPSTSTQYANITAGYTPARKWTISAISTASGGYRRYYTTTVAATSKSWTGNSVGSTWAYSLNFNPGFTPSYIECYSSSETLGRTVYDSGSNSYVITYLGNAYQAVLKSACTLTSSSVIIPCSQSGNWVVRAFS